MPYHFDYQVPKNPEGTWTIYVREDKEGAMWIGYGFEEIRVNYCPFTGTPATKQMEVEYHEEQFPEGDTYYFKKYLD